MEQIVAADAQSHIIVYDAIADWLTNIIAIITDAVIVWRAWAMWMDNTKVRWTLLLLMLADIGLGLADSIMGSQTHQSQAIALDWISFILSFFVNIIATCLISLRAWLHHKSVKSISITRKWTQGEKILLLLVESGAIYALFELLSIITSALSAEAPLSSPIYNTAALTSQIYWVVAVLNPVAIFILVHTQNTYEQSFHLEVISILSQQAQSQQISVVLSGPEGTSTDVGLSDPEGANMTHST
ncbi:hypothetical protein BDP27DRAFT_1371669 [Rhodocollybia butyracea]|uniref:Transmembrane protein n=1 Tax=Rhodocollybia butyracea TaxID=206335 RepID=A0A9P5P185_9AGAR|nr:hypothetical protein BDP27DRAFT_1438371 [Rhodocollybia butyracea]KAF9059278.1 hypothetical protein BDP27DRAFT_1371669 [Rhodocollybia butyracea]